MAEPESKIDKTIEYYNSHCGEFVCQTQAVDFTIASLKFTIMMQMCRDQSREGNQDQECWTFREIQEHQRKMVGLLLS